MAGRVVYSKKEYIVVKEGEDFIVVNTKMKYGQVNHTHIGKSFIRARNLIDFAVTKTIPKRPDNFILTSLQRISTDKKYIKELELRKRQLIEDYYKEGGV